MTVSRLEDLLSKYPWFDPAYLELGIALDQCGQVESAAERIMEAILIQPEEPVRWHSLGVVFRKLNKPNEAELAQAISLAITAKLAGRPDPGVSPDWIKYIYR